MSDQLPSAILDSTNSFDSIFALDLDTRQRFDNVLNNQQKPIDYPIPDYDKEMTPQGLPQDYLLNPQKMSGTLGEALFSSDPRISTYANDKIRQNQSKLPVNQGIGVPDHFQYSKEMDKFLKGDYGYNPYQSLEDNEDFNYRYDYLSQGLAERIFKNVGVGLSRFVGSVGFKLGQTIGYMGSMIGNGIEEIFNSKDNNFMADVADNSLSRWFEGLETDMKNSNTLSVFKPRGWEDKGFFSKMGNGAFWTDEFADGAAFMGEMVASMYMLGGLGKIGALGRLGATEINLTKSLSKLGSLGKYTGKSLDFALGTATGAKNMSDIGRWAFSVASESAFESAGLYHTKKDELKAARQKGDNTYTDNEIEAIAGDMAAASFKANMLILSASNAFENKFIFRPLFKRLGVESSSSRSNLIGLSKSTENLDEIAKASRREYKYSTWLGKKLDWKNSNARTRFYGSRALSATAAEGFWEENAQLATERLAGSDNLSVSTFAKKLKDQTLGALSGNDPEAATNIGLGALIGIGGTSIVSKVRGGDRLFQGERKKIEEDTAKTVIIYEQFRKKFLNFQDIYVRDPSTGKPILDADGNLEIDDVKAAGLLDGVNAFISKQEAVSKVADSLFRKHLQDNAMMDYVTAAKNAGIYNRALKRFDSLRDLSIGELKNLGFDPNTTVDTTYLQDSIKEFGKLYDKAQNIPPAKRAKEDTLEDELSRKDAIFKASASVYSASKIINEYQSKMLDRDYPSAFSPEAEGNTSLIQEYNSLIYQRNALLQMAAQSMENGDYYKGHIQFQGKAISDELARLDTAIVEQEEINPNMDLAAMPNGIIVSRSKYNLPEHVRPEFKVDSTDSQKTASKIIGEVSASAIPSETYLQIGIETEDQKKYAEYRNIRAQMQYDLLKFSSPDGIKNHKAYKKYYSKFQEKDEAEDNKTNPPKAGPVETTPQGQPTAPVVTSTPSQTNPASVTKKQAVPAETVITNISNMLKSLRAEENPDFTTIIAYMEENQGHASVILSLINDYIRASGDVVLDQIIKGTFNKENDESKKWEKEANFINDMLNGAPEAIGDPIFEYINNTDDAINSYKAPVIELTESEGIAIQAINEIDLTTSPLAQYAALLKNPDSTISEKKEALKTISDQLLDSNTAERVGTDLGQIASEAIYDLNYPAPVALDLTAPSAPVLNNLADLAAKAGISEDTQKVDIASDMIGVPLKVGDRVMVGTKKDGISTIKELRGDKALLEDGRQVSLANLVRTEEPIPEEPSPVEEPPVEDLPPSNDEPDASGTQKELPPPPEEPPIPPENSEEAARANENYIDEMIDRAKNNGKFVFPENYPESIVMDGDKPKIVNGAIQMKTTQGDQQVQALRAHNIKKKMGEKTNPVNFWSEDEEGNPLYKVRLEIAGRGNAAKYTPWVYNTGKGLINQSTGKLNDFPFIVAMVVDQDGSYVYFDNDGNISDKLNGSPFGFPYTVEDYKPKNLSISRRGVQLGTGEALNGSAEYLTDEPLRDISDAIRKGVQILGTIDTVASGKLSTFNVDNSHSTWAKDPKRRNVLELEESGDIPDGTPIVLDSGTTFVYSSDINQGAQTQQIKVGQPYLLDERSGIKIPLRGKLIKDLTINGKPFVSDKLKLAIEELDEEGFIQLPDPEHSDLVQNLFNVLRILVYSQNTPIFLSKDGTTITMVDKRPENKPLMETEINYTMNQSVIGDPFNRDPDYEGFSYKDFVKENFLSGIVPVELKKGQKSIEKLNRRIIFVLDKDHQQILDSIGAKASPRPTTRMTTADYSKFVNKTFKRIGGTSTVTVTGLKEGMFTITGPSGSKTQSVEDFMKNLRKLEEVNIPEVTPEITQEFTEKQKLSKEEIAEIREKSKTMTDEDINNLNFDC